MAQRMRLEGTEHRGRLDVAAGSWPRTSCQIAGLLAEAGVARLQHADAAQGSETRELVARETNLPAILTAGGGRLVWDEGELTWQEMSIEWSVADVNLHQALLRINASGSR